MRVRDIPDWVFGLIFFGLVAGVIVGSVWFEAYNEARVFNACTGSNVSTWDALWVELRVENCNGR